MNANNNIKTNQIGSITQQARLLMRGDRQRNQNRQVSMLTRASAQVGLH